MRGSAQNPLKIYQDTPLEFQQDDSIRLLTVLPERSAEGYVQCILFNASIKQMDGAYTCLSYVWGIGSDASNQVDSLRKALPDCPCPRSIENAATATPTDCTSGCSNQNMVIVNWKPMKVLRNLLDFLQIACQKYAGEPLWIDALCINQNSTIERNHQVSRMGDIYSHARQVIAWIGPCNSGVNSLDVLQDAISKVASSNEVEEMLPLNGAHRGDKIAHQHVRFSQAVENYWNRAWITQELAVARRVLLLFGSTVLGLHDIAGNTLIHAIRQTPELGWDRVPWPDAPIYQIWELATDKRWEDRNYWARVHSRLCLLDLVSQHRYKRCLHGRDRVYSLRYLCVESNDVQINYETSSSDLLFHITKVSQRSLCFCAALALVAALGETETSEEWNTVYLAIKVDTTPSMFGPRCSLREICTGTRGHLILDPDEGTLEYFSSSGSSVQFPPSQPSVLHTWFEYGATEESCTAYLSMAYLRQIMEEDKNLEGMLVLASEYQHVWKDDSVSFVSF